MRGMALPLLKRVGMVSVDGLRENTKLQKIFYDNDLSGRSSSGLWPHDPPFTFLENTPKIVKCEVAGRVKSTRQAIVTSWSRPTTSCKSIVQNQIVDNALWQRLV
jgi:hypothetical protein